MDVKKVSRKMNAHFKAYVKVKALFTQDRRTKKKDRFFSRYCIIRFNKCLMNVWWKFSTNVGKLLYLKNRFSVYTVGSEILSCIISV